MLAAALPDPAWRAGRQALTSGRSALALQLAKAPFRLCDRGIQLCLWGHRSIVYIQPVRTGH